jgi:hypothetical protein
VILSLIFLIIHLYRLLDFAPIDRAIVTNHRLVRIENALIREAKRLERLRFDHNDSPQERLEAYR